MILTEPFAHLRFIPQLIQQMGKRLGKDHAVGKLTWPGLYGIEQAGKEAARQIDMAVKAAGFFGARGEFLIALAQNSLKRVI